MTTLFTDYQKFARPLVKSSSTVVVTLQFSLMHIKDLVSCLHTIDYRRHDAVHKRARPKMTVVSCMSVCPSVWCLSRSCIMSKRVNVFSNFFHHRVAHHSGFFLCQTSRQYSDSDPQPGRRVQGYVKIAIFDQNLVLSRK